MPTSSKASGKDVAISVRGLSKCYTIAHNAPHHTTAAEALAHRLRRPFQKVETETFWALKDVSFDVQRGDVVGIIGRNGAGKSTLLKILSRIAEPTVGMVGLNGRVGSLLEVGTGFHPELTGRENIYLNGSILGMSRRDIDHHFDAIVEFAEVAQFLDTPVKRYSSGMYVRLAFAVAAHLNPEILVVDEVLAVGDAAFQKKCLGKMGEVAAKEGRTVLFVSHNMTSVLQLCNRAVLMRKGSVCADGPVRSVVENYIVSDEEKTAEIVWDRRSAPGDDIAQIRAVRVLNADGEASSEHFIEQPITLEMEFWCCRSGVRLDGNFHLYNAHGICVFIAPNYPESVGKEWVSRRYEKGLYRLRCVIPGKMLNNGRYRLTPLVVQDASIVRAKRDEAVSFTVNDTGEGKGDYTGEIIGVIRPLLPARYDILREDIE